ncbi:MAG TPA: YajQ family cyclic di-GMP-binding protein [Candidatus Saccharibacteria bacterium]|nr:YajQ family cyclic di-GMP-binding protein [Candidatus Saccharibacteria bacterium]HMT39795.1 YajQ family cyclic di-GMP-binding protein [Candidatus Saccharibacteria bacterium]
MAKDSTFDVVSEYDVSAMINACDQAQREISTRYDFQGTNSKLVFDRDAKKIEIESNSELKIEAIIGVLESKFLKANLSLKFLDKSSEILENNMISRKTIPLVQGLDQTKAKQITALIREKGMKVKTQIQGESVRVSAAKKDDLQAVMEALRSANFDFPISFNNFR